MSILIPHEVHPVELDRMESRYKVAERANVGTIVMCPTCKARFKKQTRFQRFHNHDCHSRYMSLIFPKFDDRAKHLSTSRIQPRPLSPLKNQF